MEICNCGKNYCKKRPVYAVDDYDRLLKTTYPNFTKFYVGLHVICGHGSFFSDSAIRYVLPLLWMT